MMAMAAVCLWLGLPDRIATATLAPGGRWIGALIVILAFAGSAALLLAARERNRLRRELHGAEAGEPATPMAESGLTDVDPLAEALRAAVRDGQIVPHFQPVMELEQGRIVGFEALARWRHPEQGMIPPAQFIPLAERLGLIGQVGELVLRGACVAAKEWTPDLWLSINLSPLELGDPWLGTRLLSTLGETGFAARRLFVEVSETCDLAEIEQARDAFAALQNAGVRIALDNFGRGYSRLYHLRDLGFDQLKLDSAFVHRMEAETNASVIGAITGLGKALGLPVAAKGIETWDEAKALRGLGCELAQGHLFGEALNAAETLELVKSQNAIISHLTKSG